MKVETMGRVLIAIGALVMLYARLVMPIALPGADVVNIHLISERQNTLALGGLLFFAGIVLFAVFKMKQTKEEGEQEAALQRERTDQAKALAGAVMQKTSEGASVAAKSVVESLDGGALAKIIRVAIGLVAGAFCGAQIAFISAALVDRFTDNILEPWGAYIMVGITAIIGIAYAFRKVGILKVAAHFAVAVVVLSVVNAIV